MKSIIALTLAASITSASPATAQPIRTGTLKINVADIDMGSPTGQRKIELRIARAARAFCDPVVVNAGFSLKVQRNISACERSAKRAALAALANSRAPALATN